MSITKEEIMWLMENCGPDVADSKTKVNISGFPTAKPDHEVSMATKQLKRTAKHAQSLADRMHNLPERDLPAWVQAKITKAQDYMNLVFNYLDEELDQDQAYEDGLAHGKGLAMGEIKENVQKIKNNVEINVNISKSDLKKLQEGKKIVLKDKTQNNEFILNFAKAKGS
tara:strand:- start:996 stop:1502 length:507 start_codon:yes stop_codon:yes gene_type:complete